MSNHKEEHHCIPISISGPNWKENCVALTFIEHAQVHQILDIPYGLIRRFRKRTNHLAYIDDYYVDELAKLHNLYFANFSRLSKTLQKKHIDCMKATALRAVAYYDGDRFIISDKTGSYIDQFRYYLEQYHNALYMQSKFFESRLPRQFHPS